MNALTQDLEDDATRTKGCLFPAVVVTIAGLGIMFLVVWAMTNFVMFVISLF